MIKTIIKRDGREEPFNIDKVHEWIHWAAEDVKDRIYWSEVVLQSLSVLKDKCTTSDLQDTLIKTCLNRGDYPHNLMAGRLYAAKMRKDMFGQISPPTIKEMHERLHSLGLMVVLDYSDEEYAELESVINHQKDFDMAYFQLRQAFNKYSLSDATTKKSYETPQFIFMRMAMALAETEPQKIRMRDVKGWYKYFSEGKLSAPTPNYTNLGTKQKGYSSCCVIKADDDLDSIGAADHAVMRMSANAAGIGTHYALRSNGDPVRHGLIRHAGKQPYFRSQAFQAKENMQNSKRGGAITQYFSAYDPEVFTLIRMQNPTTVKTLQIRESHFAIIYNTFLAKKAAKKEKCFHFNAFTAPDLYEAMFSGDPTEFEKLYAAYEKDKKFKKEWFDPRELIIEAKKESLAAGTLYVWNADLVNQQTPFKEKIYSSNLCMEIALPTVGYSDMMDLYSEDENSIGETAICSLASIVVPAIKSDAEYEKVAYYALKMIDKCIDMSFHPLPNVRLKAALRRSAGVGMTGIATNMAKAKVSYVSDEGRKLLHEIAERHYYFCLKASLKLGQEVGNAPWINKTKYPDGWFAHEHVPDTVLSFPLKYDWEALRKEIIGNGGIRHSVVCAIMPTESSSKLTAYPNAVYPVREDVMKKSDGENTVDWVAYDNDKLKYESAWSLDMSEYLTTMGVLQKFLDQGMSLDLYYDRSKSVDIAASDILKQHVSMIKANIQSIYYNNTRISSQENTIFSKIENSVEEDVVEDHIIKDVECESCTL